MSNKNFKRADVVDVHVSGEGDDGSTRSYEEIQNKSDEIKRMNINRMKDKDRKEDLLNILDWIQKRNDTFKP